MATPPTSPKDFSSTPVSSSPQYPSSFNTHLSDQSASPLTKSSSPTTSTKKDPYVTERFVQAQGTSYRAGEKHNDSTMSPPQFVSAPTSPIECVEDYLMVGRYGEKDTDVTFSQNTKGGSDGEYTENNTETPPEGMSPKVALKEDHIFEVKSGVSGRAEKMETLESVADEAAGGKTAKDNFSRKDNSNLEVYNSPESIGSSSRLSTVEHSKLEAAKARGKDLAGTPEQHQFDDGSKSEATTFTKNDGVHVEPQDEGPAGDKTGGSTSVIDATMRPSDTSMIVRASTIGPEDEASPKLVENNDLNTTQEHPQTSLHGAGVATSQDQYREELQGVIERAVEAKVIAMQMEIGKGIRAIDKGVQSMQEEIDKGILRIQQAFGKAATSAETIVAHSVESSANASFEKVLQSRLDTTMVPNIKKCLKDHVDTARDVMTSALNGLSTAASETVAQQFGERISKSVDESIQTSIQATIATSEIAMERSLQTSRHSFQHFVDKSISSMLASLKAFIDSNVKAAIQHSLETSMASGIEDAIDRKLQASVEAAIIDAFENNMQAAVDHVLPTSVSNAVSIAVTHELSASLDSVVNTAIDKRLPKAVSDSVCSAVAREVPASVATAVNMGLPSLIDGAVLKSMLAVKDDLAHQDSVFQNMVRNEVLMIGDQFGTTFAKAVLGASSQQKIGGLRLEQITALLTRHPLYCVGATIVLAFVLFYEPSRTCWLI